MDAQHVKNSCIVYVPQILVRCVIISCYKILQLVTLPGSLSCGTSSFRSRDLLTTDEEVSWGFCWMPNQCDFPELRSETNLLRRIGLGVL